MKKSLYILGLILMPAAAVAQTFSDDFESYAVGAKLAGASSTWATWTGAGGGADDVPVSGAKAKSGTKSVYFSSSSSTGGPTDLVLPFGGQYNTGNFSLSMWMLVETGKPAYFNLQEQTTLGKGWTVDCNFSAAGDLTLVNTISGTLLSTTYSQNQWFKVEIKADLNSNTWELLLDGTSKGIFQNGYRQVAAMDIYPTTGSGYYIDDVSYTYTPYTAPTLNAAVTYIGNVTGFLAGSVVVPSVEIRNLSATTITSATVELTYDGNTQTKNFPALSLANLATASVNMDAPITIKPGISQISAKVTLVNTKADDVSTDNEKILILNPVVPAKDKLVIGEEATGTWCQWCPRGAVALKDMDKKYHGFFQGIAVHNNDPMMFDNYDKGLNNLISGYPSAVVDRGAKIDPSGFEGDFLKRILIAPKAVIRNGATYDAGTRTLNVSLTTKFKSAASGNYKIACVLTEDSLTGSTSSWNQANAYSGGGSGAMGGFETLSNPVPASKMVYDHVARVISPSFKGMPNAFTSPMNAGDSFTHNFSFVLPANWNTSRMHVIGLFIDAGDKIDNGSVTKFSEIIKMPYTSGTMVVGVKQLAGPDDKINVYPNPSKNIFTVELAADGGKSAIVEVFDVTGKVVYNTVASGKFQIDASQWGSGVYVLKVKSAEGVLTRSLVKE